MGEKDADKSDDAGKSYRGDNEDSDLPPSSEFVRPRSISRELREELRRRAASRRTRRGD